MFKVGGPVRSRARAFLRSYALYRPVEMDRRFAAVAEIARRADPSLYAGSDLSASELKVFSQNGEDGVIVEIFNRIGVTKRYFVEFGIQDGSEGNCVMLADIFGWSGLFIEADDDHFERVQRKYLHGPVDVRHETVTAANVDSVFEDAGVPDDLDLLSIDIDGNDLYVWRALTRVRPRLVVIEYNSGILDPGPMAQPYSPDQGWDGSGAFGSTLAALDVVAAEKGYRLAHSDLAGVNAFYVRDDLWDGLGLTSVPRRGQNYGLTGIEQPRRDPPGGWVPVTG
ncbi:hypothetical protein ACVW00_002397 [Marmoricola sp. URHA0025 HA25]